MYVLKNALKNIVRNKGRNILLALVILAIIATTAIALIINNTASGIIDDYKSRFGSEVNVAPSVEKLMALGQQGKEMTAIPPELYLSFGESQYLKEVTFSCQMMNYSDSLKVVDQDKADNNSGMMIRQGGVDDENRVNPTMKLIGVSDINSLPEFKNGERKITQGEAFNAKGQCVISSELAEANDIQVGDAISIGNAANSLEEPMNLTVAGIYEDATSAYGDMPVQIPFMNRRNEVLTSLDTVISTEGQKGRSINGTFILKDPKDLQAFDSELRAKGLPEIYDVTTDESSYNKIVAPVEGLKGITLTFMIIVLILGAIILILLSIISMRERKYEIGVLRAVGMKKGKVALGLISETIAITGICLILGLGVGSLTAQPISNLLLQDQVEAAEKAQSVNAPNGGKFLIAGGKNLLAASSAEPLTEMDVGMSSQTVWEVILISLLITGAASIVGISHIIRYEPIKILSERN